MKGIDYETPHYAFLVPNHFPPRPRPVSTKQELVMEMLKYTYITLISGLL
jgi:hypothetical protein